MSAAPVSGKEAAKRRNLRVQLVLERVTKRTLDNRGWVSPAMQQGIDRESDALAFYEGLTGQVVRRSGFLRHTELMCGASLDGHVGDFEGVVEAKCPIPATHWEYLRTGVVPDGYLKQALHQLFVTGAQWCDFLSYNPDFPHPLQAKLVRIPRTVDVLKAYELALRNFLHEIDHELATIQQWISAQTLALTGV